MTQIQNQILIAICGAPGSGKSTVAEMIREIVESAVIVDDGELLRRGAMEIYDLSWDDVSTQEGKDRVLDIGNAPIKVRRVLGLLGNHLEALHGDHIIPELTLRRAQLVHHYAPMLIFPSCRKNQGAYYLRQSRHARVIEISRPGFAPINDFDRWDKSLVTGRIVNDGSLETLQARVIETFIPTGSP